MQATHQKLLRISTYQSAGVSRQIYIFIHLFIILLLFYVFFSTFSPLILLVDAENFLFHGGFMWVL